MPVFDWVVGAPGDHKIVSFKSMDTSSRAYNTVNGTPTSRFITQLDKYISGVKNANAGSLSKNLERRGLPEGMEVDLEVRELQLAIKEKIALDSPHGLAIKNRVDAEPNLGYPSVFY